MIRQQKAHVTAARRWPKYRTLPARTEYLKSRHRLQKEVRRSKQFCWRLWCAHFQRSNPWQLLRKVKPKMPPIVDDLTCGDNLITTDRDKASTLAEVFFPALPAANLPIHRKFDTTWDIGRPPGALGFSPFTIAELCKACAQNEEYGSYRT